MKKILVLLAILCVLPLAHADRPRNHHIREAEMKVRMDEMQLQIDGFVDQSANILALQARVAQLETANIALEARVKFLETEQEHVDVMSKMFMPPTTIRMYLSDLSYKGGALNSIQEMILVQNVIEISLHEGVDGLLTGQKWIVFTPREGVGTKYFVGDSAYWIAFTDTPVSREVALNLNYHWYGTRL